MKKCNIIKNFNVNEDDQYPLHNQNIIINPYFGIILKNLQITIQAQYLIWDQINTYPIKDSNIKIIKIENPIVQVLFIL
jgi:hypothetical protein